MRPRPDTTPILQRHLNVAKIICELALVGIWQLIEMHVHVPICTCKCGEQLNS